MPLISWYDEKPKLHCPTCDYDLHGLRCHKGRFRCPECGQATSISGIVTAHNQRRRHERKLTVAIGAFLALCGMASSSPLSSHWFPDLGTADWFILGVGTLIGWVYSIRWRTTPIFLRIIFSVGNGVLLRWSMDIFGPQPTCSDHSLNVMSLIAWVLLSQWWALWYKYT